MNFGPAGMVHSLRCIMVRPGLWPKLVFLLGRHFVKALSETCELGRVRTLERALIRSAQRNAQLQLRLRALTKIDTQYNDLLVAYEQLRAIVSSTAHAEEALRRRRGGS
jgi:hypothetical protein